ncbi:MAG: DNA primase [Acidobacteriota bacterium]|nr:DNA primase [Acidobacteriota bacterium]MDE3147451.1 DNA primase [Acidobacteriota bacterium]
MAISEAEIAQVRAATDIVALITEHVALKKAGRRWQGLCPFHAEKSPSFSVNAEEGRYYCFGCRVAGDQITFVREMQHLDFVDAVRLLADRAGIELHEDDASGPARKERQEFLAAMDRAVQWYHERLLHSPDARPARDYLRSRGISGDVARQFRLGWAPDDWDALASSLGLSAKVLEGTGLGFVNRRERRQDALRARLIFPIFDSSGKAIAVGGRILPGAPEDPDGFRQAKYKNSPETPIYSKRRTLYGLNWAKDDIIRSGEIIVCEGYTDVIACFQSGLARAVATCGTALGEEHFRIMRNFAKRIVLAYDADAAGQSAAASVYQWERQHEVDVFVAALPAGSDPAELAQRDPSALAAAIAGAVPFLQFRLDRVLNAANLATAEGRARGAEVALRVLAEHPSDLVRDQYLLKVADTLRLDLATLRPRVGELVRDPTQRIRVAERPLAPRASEPLPRPGLEALRLVIHFPQDVRDRFVAQYFVNEVQREIFCGLTSGQGVSEVIDQLRRRGEDGAAEVLSELAVDELDREYTVDDVAAVVAQLLRAAAAVQLRELDRQLRNAEVPPEVAMATVRDVKERLALLDTAQHEAAEADLREWLIASSAPRG